MSKIISNAIPVSPEVKVRCPYCSSTLLFSVGEGRWRKSHACNEDINHWIFKCPACEDVFLYPRIPDREDTFLERLFGRNYGMM